MPVRGPRLSMVRNACTHLFVVGTRRSDEGNPAFRLK
jgi:hypothetical protein